MAILVIAILMLAALALAGGAATGEDVQVPPGDDTGKKGVETVPPVKEPVEFQVTNWMLILLVMVIVSSALASYAPGEIRRMRIRSAQREYMDARLALARGDYPSALVGFDIAIEEAQMAYTRRNRIGGPAEWVLMPDEFYINLWRGRAQALMGIGRERLANATFQLADELVASVGAGAALK
jgi:hypothetical protein